MQLAAAFLCLALAIFVFWGESYKMQAGYLNIGLTGTDMSGSYYLPRIVGYARAAEALMTARRIGAEELLEWGFANKVVADEDVVEEAVKMAEAMIQELCSFGSSSYQGSSSGFS